MFSPKRERERERERDGSIGKEQYSGEMFAHQKDTQEWFEEHVMSWCNKCKNQISKNIANHNGSLTPIWIL